MGRTIEFIYQPTNGPVSEYWAVRRGRKLTDVVVTAELRKDDLGVVYRVYGPVPGKDEYGLLNEGRGANHTRRFVNDYFRRQDAGEERYGKQD